MALELTSAPQAVDLIQVHLRWLGLPELLVTKEEADRVWGTDPTGQIEAYCKAQKWSRDLLETIQSHHGKSAVASYRERNCRGGLQVVVHVINGERVLEVDHDLDPPQHERPIAIFRHMWEVIQNAMTKRKTNQAAVAAILRDRGIIA